MTFQPKIFCLLGGFSTVVIAFFVSRESWLQAADNPQKRNGLPKVSSTDFEDGKLTDWEPTDKSAWKISKSGKNTVYSLIKKRSEYEPPVRSPYNRSLLKNVSVSDFVMDVKLKSTQKDYNHRDLCLFFGFQDNSHFYYVHLGKKTDDHANQIFIVNGKPRKKISYKTTDGTNWDDAWHDVRIVRDIESGKIDVYFDDMKKPVMQAVDKTFRKGRIGVGSFDDTGEFDDFVLYGHKVQQQSSQ